MKTEENNKAITDEYTEMQDLLPDAEPVEAAPEEHADIPPAPREKSVRMFGYPSARKRMKMRKEQERLIELGELDPDAVDAELEPEEPPIPYRMSPQGATALAVMLSLGLVLTILGVVGIVLYAALRSGIFASHIWVLPMFIAALVIGLILLPVSVKRYHFVMRFFLYIKAIGQNTSVPVDALAKASKQEPTLVIQDLEKMIRLKYFPDGSLSEDKKILYLTEDHI